MTLEDCRFSVEFVEHKTEQMVMLIFVKVLRYLVSLLMVDTTS